MLRGIFRLIHGKLRKVTHVDGLKSVVFSASEGADAGEVPQAPRHVVDENGLSWRFSEEDGGAQDAVRETGSCQGLFQAGFAAEVGEGTRGVGMCDARVDDALHAGFFRGGEEAQSVLYR